jgi:hypothetical protein
MQMKTLFHRKERIWIGDDRKRGPKEIMWTEAEGHETDESLLMMGFIICTVRENTQRKGSCVVHVSCVGHMNEFKSLLGIPKRERIFGCPIHSSEGTISMCLRGIWGHAIA